MANIELPTYRAIRPNEVFGRRYRLSDDPKVPDKLTELLSLKLFRVPTQEEVINFIQERAKEYGLKPPEKIELFSSNPLADYLGSLPAEEVKRIAEGQKDSLDHLKEHSLGTPLKRGETYLEANNILVPSLELETFPKDEPLGNIPCNWSLRFKLLNDGKLPDRLELDYLMDRGVKDSDVLAVQGNFGEYGIVTNQIKILSNALNSPHQVAKIKNRTSDFLIEEASANIGLAAQCLSLTGSDGGLGDILQQAIENMANGNPGESNGNYFHCGGDPSRN